MREPNKVNRRSSSRQGNTSRESQPVKIKSSVITPPEPTPHPKDYDSIEY